MERNWQYWVHKTNTSKAENTTQKTYKMSNKDHTKNRGWTQAPAKDKQFMSLIKINCHL